MTMKRPQSSPSHVSRRKSVQSLGNYAKASELYEQFKNPKIDNNPFDPNKAPERPSGSPRAKRLHPRRILSPVKWHAPGTRSGASSRAETTLHMGSGLYLTKSEDKIAVTLKTDFSEPETPPVRKTPVENLKERIRELENEIVELKTRIDILVVSLEEEKMSHRLTKKSAADELHAQLQELKESHMDALKDLKREFSYQLDEQKRKFQYQCERSQQEFQNALDQKSYELELVERAFETYKQNIAAEVAQKLDNMEKSLKEEAQKEKLEALAELKRSLDLEREIEIEKLHAKYKLELKLMFQEKEREKEELLKSFNEATEDLVKFRSAIEELDGLKDKLNNAKTEIRTLKREVMNRNNEIYDLNMKIKDFQANFAHKVQQVEEKFWLKAESMLSEKTDLKRRYNQKCNELFALKAEISGTATERSVIAAQTMITLVSARVKAGVQINPFDLRLEGMAREEFDRPLSAPMTQREEDHAKLCAGMHEAKGDKETKLNEPLIEDFGSFEVLLSSRGSRSNSKSRTPSSRSRKKSRITSSRPKSSVPTLR